VSDHLARGRDSVGDQPQGHRLQHQETLHQVHDVGLHETGRKSSGEWRG